MPFWPNIGGSEVVERRGFGRRGLNRVFRRRDFQKLFPPGVVAIFLLGLVIAPRVVGSSDVKRILIAAVLFGLAVSAVLFGILKLLELRKKR